MVAQLNGTASTVDGIVGARNDRGLRLSGEAEWRNLSKWAEPAPIIPNVGLPVRLTLDRSGFVRNIETRTDGSDASGGSGDPPKGSEAPEPGRETQIRRMNVLTTATAILSSRGAVDVDAVLQVASVLEGWICR